VGLPGVQLWSDIETRSTLGPAPRSVTNVLDNRFVQKNAARERGVRLWIFVLLLGDRTLEHAVDLLVRRIDGRLSGLSGGQRLVGSALCAAGSLAG
jgi:hypothetical protein